MSILDEQSPRRPGLFLNLVYVSRMRRVGWCARGERGNNTDARDVKEEKIKEGAEGGEEGRQVRRSRGAGSLT